MIDYIPPIIPGDPGGRGPSPTIYADALLSMPASVSK